MTETVLAVVVTAGATATPDPEFPAQPLTGAVVLMPV
jgi:hypothetical protein